MSAGHHFWTVPRGSPDRHLEELRDKHQFGDGRMEQGDGTMEQGDKGEMDEGIKMGASRLERAKGKGRAEAVKRGQVLGPANREFL